MIPSIEFSSFTVGSFTLYTWGLFAAVGFLVASFVAARRAKAVGLNAEVVWEVSWRVIVAAMVGARMFEVVFYNPVYYWANPYEIVDVTAGGLSVYGGIIGGALTILWYLRSRALPLLRWFDVFAFAAPLGLMIGRIGCFFINDHPGTPTAMPWGVRYPDGPRHDGGLEMAVADGVIFLIMVTVGRRHSTMNHQPSPTHYQLLATDYSLPTAYYPLRPGFLAALFLGLKGLARFIQDFFRATDLPIIEARYFGLTPAQYVGLLSVIVGIIILHRLWLSRRIRNKSTYA